MRLGYTKPLYILPFDHRATFQTGMFGWKGILNPEQTAQIVATKAVIYDALKAAVTAGVPKEQAGILVDEQFGAAILLHARRDGYITSAPAEKSGQEEFDFEYGEDFATHIETFEVYPNTCMLTTGNTCSSCSCRPRQINSTRWEGSVSVTILSSVLR